MGWFASARRMDHPCNFPSEGEMKEHRVLEFWRCETCNDLFQLSGGLNGRILRQISSPWVRWLYRKEGYTHDPVS